MTAKIIQFSKGRVLEQLTLKSNKTGNIYHVSLFEHSDRFEISSKSSHLKIYNPVSSFFKENNFFQSYQEALSELYGFSLEQFQLLDKKVNHRYTAPQQETP